MVKDILFAKLWLTYHIQACLIYKLFKIFFSAQALTQVTLCYNWAKFCSILANCGPKCDFAKIMTLKGQGHSSI